MLAVAQRRGAGGENALGHGQGLVHPRDMQQAQVDPLEAELVLLCQVEAPDPVDPRQSLASRQSCPERPCVADQVDRLAHAVLGDRVVERGCEVRAHGVEANDRLDLGAGHGEFGDELLRPGNDVVQVPGPDDRFDALDAERLGGVLADRSEQREVRRSGPLSAADDQACVVELAEARLDTRFREAGHGGDVGRSERGAKDAGQPRARDARSC